MVGAPHHPLHLLAEVAASIADSEGEGETRDLISAGPLRNVTGVSSSAQPESPARASGLTSSSAVAETMAAEEGFAAQLTSHCNLDGVVSERRPYPVDVVMADGETIKGRVEDLLSNFDSSVARSQPDKVTLPAKGVDSEATLQTFIGRDGTTAEVVFDSAVRLAEQGILPRGSERRRRANSEPGNLRLARATLREAFV